MLPTSHIIPFTDIRLSDGGPFAMTSVTVFGSTYNLPRLRLSKATVWSFAIFEVNPMKVDCKYSDQSANCRIGNQTTYIRTKALQSIVTDSSSRLTKLSQRTRIEWGSTKDRWRWRKRSVPACCCARGEISLLKLISVWGNSQKISRDSRRDDATTW
jgi:hypothetical protein